MQRALNKDAALAVRSSVNIAGNAVNLALGTKIIIQSGHVLTITKQGVEVSDEDNLCDYGAYSEARAMAAALSYLLWGDDEEGAGDVTGKAGFANRHFADSLTKIMRCFGIDASKPFTVNGITYDRDFARRVQAHEDKADE